MKNLIYIIPFMCLLACSSNMRVKGTSWTVQEEGHNITMSFGDSIVEIVIKNNGEIVGEVSGEYSFADDTILIGKPNSCDKAVIKGNKLLFIEESGTTVFKKVK
ncbi:MAG: hypothetical protein KHY35_13465 [Bacteroides thetaiotaomicron]|uniref:Uncharacterized protein n=1 Tax=Bacteroides thetaiotaomicron TaxID=818 RepID=A0A943DRA4_BACT4|nr:hypothetical protein [Bacteroides thetaiotaomicron]